MSELVLSSGVADLVHLGHSRMLVVAVTIEDGLARLALWISRFRGGGEE